MEKIFLIFMCLGILLVLPGLVLADCDDLGGFSSFTFLGSNTVVLQAGSTASGQFDVQDCSVQQGSTIQLLNNKVCDGDEVIIDGSRCRVMNVRTSD